MRKVSVVTPWIDHPELIPAYEKAMTGAEVVVVDNGSNAETAEALDRMAERLGNGSWVIHNRENRYFTTANNQGWGAATGDVVAFVNNDVEGEGWLANLEADVAENGLYGPSVTTFIVDGDQYPYVEGWCVAALRADWDKLLVPTGMDLVPRGPWDQVNYPRCYGDDLDLSFRARLAGLSIYCAAWPIGHIGNYTNRTLEGAYDFAEANRAVFSEQVRRWKQSR